MELHLRDLIVFIVLLTIPCSSAAFCNRTCGARQLPFPFGFSPGCQIQLGCTANATVLAAGFHVRSVKAGTIVVDVPAKCHRPVAALHRLFTESFAPTSSNAILLHDCVKASSDCLIPSTTVQTHFEQVDCEANKSTVSCYSDAGDNVTSFIDYENLTRSGCRSLFSSISMEAAGDDSSVSLDVQVVRLGWWLRGECRCSRNANCVSVLPPKGGGSPPAYRCECIEGFSGDGFLDGAGCRKESACDPSNYLSGECGGTTRVGVLVGGVAAGASFMVSLGLVFCFIRRRSKMRNRSKNRRKLFETTGITIPIYPYKEMEKATDFFSEKRRLGNGAYGTVYSGKLEEDDNWVAVKRIRRRDADTIEQVINEIKLLSSVSHPNLVRLLGCSIENEEQILVYEFMPNGTLSEHLHRHDKASSPPLPWPVRLTIAAETAQAISYLHNAMHPPIYHRDIKSTNILLDHNFNSKVADFGLSRLGIVESSHISTAPQGTPGYLDPQYHQHFHLSDKSDVYSFGVVLIEIITALRVVDFGRPQNEVNLAALAVDRIGRGCLDEIIDPFLKLGVDDDGWTHLSVHKVAELAFRCVAFHRDMRPSMMEAAIELEQIRLSRWSDSETSITSGSSPLNVMGKKQHEYGFFSCSKSLDTAADSWQSDQSSPSSNSLLNRLAR